MNNRLIKLTAFAFSLMLAIVFTSLPFTLNVQASQTPYVRINGEFLHIYDEQPIMIEHIVVVPLRAVVETLGYTIRWDSQTQTAALSKSEHTSYVKINSSDIIINGEVEWGYIPAQLVNDRTLVCLRTISLITGMNVQWDRVSNIVDIFISDVVRPETILRPISSPIQTSVDGFELGLNPEELVRTLEEKDIAIHLPYAQDWDTIYENIADPVRDGRRYNVGGDFSFSFVIDDIIFNYTYEGLMESIYITTAQHRTSENVGVGDSRSRVIEAHGTAYMESPFTSGVIEYFDGENYLFFVFGGDFVLSWGIGQISIFEIHAQIFS
ncbi:MAG: copper amine oxidase N-terminal domain-containing protein [Defluviitaleaceae bacterium]|nr:copper amine oxidase N-terminal domain-containing protein [Defluviitaleaceae bacterium]